MSDTFDGVFFISLSTIMLTGCGIILRYCLKSKCENFSLCCGLLTIHRRTDQETEEHITDLNNGITDNNNINNI